MAKYKERGAKSENSNIQISCWQQDISKREKATLVGKVSVAAIATAWLYYQSLLAVFILFPIWLWYGKRLKEECVCKKQRVFLEQFKEMIQMMASSLNAGYSVENAIRESRKELQLIYGENERIMRELSVLISQLRVQIPVEKAIEELAERVCLEDVDNFAAIFITAKRSGGDVMAIIKNSVAQIADKIDVKREIDTILAAKRYEFKIMAAVPYVIIAYMSLSFPEFFDCLYGNILGIGVMTICLGIYVAAYFLGVKLIEIEV